MAAAKRTKQKRTKQKSARRRKVDIVAFGATGFTGGLIAEYLAKRAKTEDFTFAIAGRRRARLGEVRRALARINKDCADIPIIEADSADAGSLAEMAAGARVVLSTVGPFARYGMPLVEACVAAGTDYVDSTGEPDFVSDVIGKFGRKAARAQLRIVNCCGFDSIPADLGAYLTRKELPTDVPATIRGFVEMDYGAASLTDPLASVSGGTWHSALNFVRPRELTRRAESLREIADHAGRGRTVEALPLTVVPPGDGHRWGAPLPLVDVEIVLRSAAAMTDYGREFRYGHYAEIGSLAMLGAGAVAAGTVAALAQLKPTRDLLLSLKKPGDGPSAAQRRRNRFRVKFYGEADGARAEGLVAGGDPGYGETSKMMSESALALALDRRRLPRRYGVLTPAAAMGDVLVERLREAGLTLEATRV